MHVEMLNVSINARNPTYMFKFKTIKLSYIKNILVASPFRESKLKLFIDFYLRYKQRDRSSVTMKKENMIIVSLTRWRSIIETLFKTRFRRNYTCGWRVWWKFSTKFVNNYRIIRISKKERKTTHGDDYFGCV